MTAQSSASGGPTERERQVMDHRRENPEASIRETARATGVPSSTVSRWLRRWDAFGPPCGPVGRGGKGTVGKEARAEVRLDAALQAIAEGATMAEAASMVQRSISTVMRWLAADGVREELAHYRAAYAAVAQVSEAAARASALAALIGIIRDTAEEPRDRIKAGQSVLLATGAKGGGVNVSVNASAKATAQAQAAVAAIDGRNTVTGWLEQLHSMGGYDEVQAVDLMHPSTDEEDAG